MVSHTHSHTLSHTHTFRRLPTYLLGSFSSLTTAIALLSTVAFLSCIFVHHFKQLRKEIAVPSTPARKQTAGEHALAGGRQELEEGWGRGTRWKGEDHGVAMAAAVTTVYLIALLNRIQPITIRDQLQWRKNVRDWRDLENPAARRRTHP